MTPMDKNEIVQLMKHEGRFLVSILIPGKRWGLEKLQGPIRLKHCLQLAEDECRRLGMPARKTQAFLQPARDWIKENDFWEHQKDGIAFFLGPDFFRVYNAPLRLEEQVVVADRFYVKPLFPLLEEHPYIYILALSQNQVRFFQATHYSIESEELPGAPSDLDSVMAGFDTEREQQFHTETPLPAPTVGTRRPPIYYGRGLGSDPSQMKRHIFEYCKLVDAAVNRRLLAENAPLLLAATEPVDALYRQASTYPNLDTRGVIAGNPDHLQPAALHQKALDMDLLFFDAGQRRQAIDRYRDLTGSGRSTSRSEQILTAAHNGQVDTLFVSLNDHLWGRYHPDQDRLDIHPQRLPGDEDLLDLATVKTYLNNGMVYALRREQMPEGPQMAAILRYPLAAAPQPASV